MKCVVVFILFLLPAFAQSESVRVGPIDFFGTTGIEVVRLRNALPIRTGDRITKDGFEQLRTRIRKVIVQLTGHPETDIAAVCCDSQGELLLYIGLGGSNSHVFRHLPTPQGSQCLPQAAVDLYSRAMDANAKAVEHGDSGEDDSQGYAVAHNPELRKAQLHMREFALHNVNAIEAALRSCSNGENRRAASELLGYSDPSTKQIAALVRATEDADSLVRNNAIRALGVLISSKKRAKIPAERLIPLLNSDLWTDRNKAGLLFMRLTEGRQQSLLSALAQHAFESLVEMARWQEQGHAVAYRVILGRIAGMNEERIRQLANDGVEEIVAAAEAADREHTP